MILGIWDGHESSACLVNKGKLIAGVSEERFTRRKLEPLFPVNSIRYCLKSQNLKPNEIYHIAISTSDWSVTLSRSLSWLKNDFWYKRRRHLTNKPITWDLDLQILNQTGKIKSNSMFRKISKFAIKKILLNLGFNMKKTKIHLVDHHTAHAASAYFTSGLKKATCVTLDALGDGYSSTISICENNEIKTIARNKTKDSLGLFFQEVTSIMGLRILEDEGKVMALSDYAYVDNKKNNPMLNYFTVHGTKITSNFSLLKRYQMQKNLHWRNKSENFAHMAQDALEHFTTKLVDNSVKKTGIKDVVLAGGIASNIKMNMKIRDLNSVNKCHIFPAMVDTGLSAGAALYVSNKILGTKPYQLKNVYLGPEYSNTEIKKTLQKYKDKINFTKDNDSSNHAGELISNNKIVFNHQGKMEFGPRALGNRSILASASSIEVKNLLNTRIKKRSWFQPFCPSLLEKEATKFVNEKEYNRFMTMGYMLKKSSVDHARSTMNVDKSIRPQILHNENPRYEKLIKRVKKETGQGIVLNTSFNIHGEPIVNSPKDAINTMLNSKAKNMFIGDYYVQLK